MSSLRLLVNRKLVVLGAGELGGRALAFVAMAYLFRVLGDANYGRVETTLAVLQFCMLGVEQGLGMLGAREIARDRASTPVWVRRIVSTQAVFALAVVAAWIVAAEALPLDPLLTRLMQGFALSLLAVPFLLHWVYLGQDRMFWVSAPKVLRYGAFLLIVVLLVRTPADTVKLPLAEIAGAALMALCYVAVYRRSGGPLNLGLRNALDRELLREGLPIGGSQLIWALRMYLPIVLIGATAGPAAAGIFGAAHRIIMVFQALFDVYFTKLFPTMSLSSSVSTAQFRGVLSRSMHLLMWPSIALAIALTFTGAATMRTVFGVQHDVGESGRVLSLLFWLVPLFACRRHARTALITLNLQRGELVCSLIGVVALVALLVPLTAAYGAVGSASAMLITEVLATGLAWLLLGRHLRHWRSQGQEEAG